MLHEFLLFHGGDDPMHEPERDQDIYSAEKKNERNNKVLNFLRQDDKKGCRKIADQKEAGKGWKNIPGFPYLAAGDRSLIVIRLHHGDQHRYDGKTADNGKEIKPQHGHAAQSSVYAGAIIPRLSLSVKAELFTPYFFNLHFSAVLLQFSRLLRITHISFRWRG